MRAEEEKLAPHRPLTERETAAYCRRLSVFSASGLPEALVFAAEGAGKGVKSAANALKEDVLAGMPLSEAFAREKFAPAALPFIRLAEKSGSLGKCLSLAAEALERKARLKENFLETAGYPLLLGCLLLALFLVFSLLILPAFEEAFLSLGLALPAFTAAVMTAGRTLSSALPWLFLSAAALAAFYVLLRHIPAARLKSDALKLYFPAEKAKCGAMFSRALSLLLRGGATLPEALGMAAPLLPNARAEEGVRRAGEHVFAGCPLSNALKEEGVFPAFLLSLIAAGERTGSLEALLEGALPALEGEYAAALKRRAGIVRTVLFALLAAMLILLFAALYEPIFLLITAI